VTLCPDPPFGFSLWACSGGTVPGWLPPVLEVTHPLFANDLHPAGLEPATLESISGRRKRDCIADLKLQGFDSPRLHNP